MIKLFSVAEMLSIEKEANQTGLNYEMMMENAGYGIAKEIQIAYSHLPNKKIIGLIGPGNNGGDTLISLSHLALENWRTCAYIVRTRPENDPLISRLEKNNGKVVKLDNDINLSQLSNLLETYSVIVDGILGTGVKLPIKDEIAKVLSFINDKKEKSSNQLHIIAVDCPTGVDCDSGEVAPETIPAEITITMAGMKLGLIKFPAANFTGEIRVASIGPIEHLPAFTKNNKFILNKDTVKLYLPTRPLDSHKGTFGTAIIVAGSMNFTGAALLAGMAAYRIGAGLVTMAVPEPLHCALSGSFPEATWLLLPHERGVISANASKVLQNNISQATALLIGPGFGIEDTTKEFIKTFLTTQSAQRMSIGFIHDQQVDKNCPALKIPMVIDADGLKLIAGIDNWPSILPSMTVLTPHPGEMAKLTSLSTENIQKNRLEVAKEFSAKWGHIVVLKGAFTVIADPKGQIAIVPVATPALAKAGTGDVLAGLIAGLLAQRTNPFQAACCGAWIHANAGLMAAKRLGNDASVLASDVLNAVPEIISQLR